MHSTHLVKLLGALAVAVVAVGMLASAASAKTPAPGYTQFAGCPSAEENPAVEVCFVSKIESGNFKMGNKNVPITNPFTLSGGITETGIVSANAKGGLQVVKQKVPGGVIGLTGLTWLAEFLGSEALTLYAATELVGQPSNPLGEPVFLPVRIHLINGALGNNCYVGSPAEPIKLNLITGTTSPPLPNKPITGNPGKTSFTPDEIIHVTGGKFVDNSFAAPGANGCTLTLFGFIPISINGLVNSASGLPAKAGTNETVQNFSAEIAATQFVYP
jgi:hypothetical protein